MTKKLIGRSPTKIFECVDGPQKFSRVIGNTKVSSNVEGEKRAEVLSKYLVNAVACDFM